MKKILITVCVVVVAVFLLSVAKDMVIKTAAEKAVGAVTGLELDIGSLNVGILKTLVNAKGIYLKNPPGFEDRLMLSAPELHVDYVLSEAVKGDIHLESLRISIDEFSVVKNSAGALNLDSLKVVKAEKEGKKPESVGKGEAPNVRIDDFYLRIGKVTYKDYSRGPKPSVTEYNLNLEERFTGVDDPYSLVSIIVVKALMNTAIARLSDFDLGGLEDSVSGVLSSAQKAMYDTTEKAKEAIGRTQDKAEEAVRKAKDDARAAVRDAKESLGKTAEDLKGILKSPFGAE